MVVLTHHRFMRMAIAGFALGIMLLQRQAALPAAWMLWLPVLVILPLCVRRVASGVGGARAGQHVLFLALGLSLGFAWAAWRAEWRLADALPDEWQSTDIDLQGVISELPDRKSVV